MNNTPEFNKTLPFDEFAERAILGAMLIDNSQINRVFSEIDSDDFYKETHKYVAAAIHKLYDSRGSVDTVTVSGYLKDRKKLKFSGGFDYINSLTDDIPENFNVDEYVKKVKDRASLRKIILTSLGVIQKGVSHKVDTDSILDELQEDIIKISDRRIKKGFHSSAELIPETIDLIDKIQEHGESTGIKTGFFELDHITSGFQRGDLVIIAARPSMGKTALALNIAVNMAVKDEKSVGFFSIEMSKMQIMLRLLALRAKVNMKALRTGKPHLNEQDKRSLSLAASELQKAKLFIDDSASLSIIEMKTRARRLWNENNLDIIFVDYLQLMKVTGEYARKSDTRAQEVTTITASLKELAKELNIPVVGVAQLNRAPEQRGLGREKGSKYQLSDLKESGAIEQDADVVMFLHRDDQVNTDSERKGEADLIIAKQRNGPTGRLVLAFMDKFTKFENFELMGVESE